MIALLNHFHSPKQKALAEAGWNNTDNTTHQNVQNSFSCCGFTNSTDDLACQVN